MSKICTTLDQDLQKAERTRCEAHIKAAVRDTLRTITGYDFCPSGGENCWLTIDLNSYFSQEGSPWMLLGPWPEGMTKQEQVFRSLYAMLPVDAHHFWLWPYYHELKKNVTFFRDLGDPYVTHKMCQPFYWEGVFTGNAGQYTVSPTMTLKAMYTFPLTKDWQVYLREQEVDPPIAITLRFDIENVAWKFPGLDLSHKVTSPAGKKVYGIYAELQGWNALRWHGGNYQWQNYPHYRQVFWNACAEDDCSEEWK